MHKQRVWLCAHKNLFVDPENYISYDFQGSQSILSFFQPFKNGKTTLHWFVIQDRWQDVVCGPPCRVLS